MVNLVIDRSKIHAMANETKRQLSSKNIKRMPHNKPVSFDACLQIVCQSLFSAPYEEVLKTHLLATDTLASTNTNDVCQVVILSYGAENIVALKGEYYVASCRGTDSEICDEEIQNQALTLAKAFSTTVKLFALPEILSDEWEYEDIIALAKKMGVFDYATTIFEMFEDDDNKIFLNGNDIAYRLNGEWETEMQEIVENGDEDPLEHTIWFTEYTNESFELYEHAFSFDDLCHATPQLIGKGKSWNIPEDVAHVNKIEHLVTFYY